MVQNLNRDLETVHKLVKGTAKTFVTIKRMEEKRERKSKYKKNRKTKICPLCGQAKERLDKHLQGERSECGKELKDNNERKHLILKAKVRIRNDKEITVVEETAYRTEKEQSDDCVGCEDITEVAEDMPGGSDEEGDELMRQFLFAQKRTEIGRPLWPEELRKKRRLKNLQFRGESERKVKRKRGRESDDEYVPETRVLGKRKWELVRRSGKGRH